MMKLESDLVFARVALVHVLEGDLEGVGLATGLETWNERSQNQSCASCPSTPFS